MIFNNATHWLYQICGFDGGGRASYVDVRRYLHVPRRQGQGKMENVVFWCLLLSDIVLPRTCSTRIIIFQSVVNEYCLHSNFIIFQTGQRQAACAVRGLPHGDAHWTGRWQCQVQKLMEFCLYLSVCMVPLCMGHLLLWHCLWCTFWANTPSTLL